MTEDKEILGTFREESTGREMRMLGYMDRSGDDRGHGVPVFQKIEVAVDGRYVPLQEFIDG